MKTIKLNEHAEYVNVVRRVAPKYRKHSAFLTFTNKVEPNDTCWDGGSRRSYLHVDRFGIVHHVPSPTAPPQFGGGEPKVFEIPEGEYVVSVGTFRGKTAVAHIYHNSGVES